MEKPSTKKPMNVLKTMVFLKNFMKKLIEKIEADDYCYGDPWGETTCPEFNQDTNICNEDCLECKIQRIKNIIESIKFNK